MCFDLGLRVRSACIAALGIGLLACSALRGEEKASDEDAETATKRPPLARVYHEARVAPSRKATSGGAVRDNPAANVQRFLRSSTGGQIGTTAAPQATSAPDSGSATPPALGTPTPRQVSPREAIPAEPDLPQRAPPPVPTSLGTARYMNRYQAMRQGLNFLDGVGVTVPGSVYAGGGYLSGAPLTSNPYYPSTGPVAPQRPYDNYLSTSPGAELYHRYWPLMLDRDADGDYHLDAVDIYFMLQGGY